MLCSICDNITLKALHSQNGYKHMSSLDDLKASAEANVCSLCLLLWSAAKYGLDSDYAAKASMMQYPVRLGLDGMMESFRRKEISKILNKHDTLSTSPRPGWDFPIYKAITSKAPAIIQIFALEPDTSQEVGVRYHRVGRLSFYREAAIDPLMPETYGGRPISTHANSVESFQLAARWILRCLTEHDGCRRAVCPYQWTDEIDQGKWQSDSSDDESDFLGPLFQPPSKRLRRSSSGDSKVPRSPSSCGHRYLPDPYDPQKRLQKKMGYLDRLNSTFKRSKNFPYEFEDGSWRLYHRTESLQRLEKEGSVLLRDCSIPFLPTRYICVDSDPPRLSIAEPDSRGFYVALSHCWGTSKSLRTTTATLADHVKGIPVASMPQTFRDAVLITRELGIEYLWIDSLCILQDSKDDWQRESSKMGTLYSNAFLTISAAGSTDSTMGIFRPRSVPTIPPVRIEPRDSDHTSLLVAEFSENTPFEKRQPIDSRAWCLQEITLSPRVLIYGTEMLGWLCDSTTDVEHGCIFDHEEDPCLPTLAPRLHRQIRPQPTQKWAGIGNFDLYTYLEEKERATGYWAYTVNDFTKRKLTHQSDRLPALSGLAKEIQLQTGDEYLAGLWKKSLRYDLLWQVAVLFSEPGTEWKRPDTYRAPTWSWASIEGPVTLNLKSNAGIIGPGPREPPPKFQLLEARVDPAGLDPLGEVSGGCLKLSAALRKVKIQKRDWQKEEPSNSVNSPWEIAQLEARYYTVLTMQGARFGRCCLDMPDEKPWDSTDLWWLSLSIYDGLLVTSGQKEGEYLRVGHAWFHDPFDMINGLPPEFSVDEYVEVILL